MAQPPSDVSSAQNLEDVRLWRVLYDSPDRCFVDVGANHPTLYSITKWFSDRGWTGINIEPGPEFALLVAERSRDINLNVAIGVEEGFCDIIVPGAGSGRASTRHEYASDPALLAVDPNETVMRVPQRPLADVLAEYLGDRAIGFLTVDVEGAEADVLGSNDWSRYRPAVVVVEAIDPVRMNPSHHEWEPILLAHDYSYAVSDGLNRFYVANERSELLERFDVDFVGRFMVFDPDHVRALARHNAALIEQVEAVRASPTFRLGSVLMTPARPVRALALAVQPRWRRRPSRVRDLYRAATAVGKPLETVRSDRVPLAECPVETPGFSQTRSILTERIGRPAQLLSDTEAETLRRLVEDSGTMPGSVGHWAERCLRMRALPRPGRPTMSDGPGCVLIDLRHLQGFRNRDINVGMGSYGAALVAAVMRYLRDRPELGRMLVGLVEVGPVADELVAGFDRIITPAEIPALGAIALVVDPGCVAVPQLDPASGDLLSLVPKWGQSLGIWWDNTTTEYGEYFLRSPEEVLACVKSYEVYAKLDHVLALSRAAARDGNALFAESSTVDVIGASSPILEHPAPTVRPCSEEVTVLLVGNGLPHKNLAAGVAAVARLGDTNVRLTIWALLSTDQQDALLSFAADLDVDPERVQFRSQVPEAEVAVLLADADVVVVPSFAEGFSLPVAEALHCGTPVVGSSIPAHEELIGPGWWLVPPDRPVALGRALRRALRDPASLLSTQQEQLARTSRPGRFNAEANRVLDRILGPGATTEPLIRPKEHHTELGGT